MHVCMFAYTYLCVCTRVCMYVFISMLYKHMCVYVYIYIWNKYIPLCVRVYIYIYRLLFVTSLVTHNERYIHASRDSYVNLHLAVSIVKYKYIYVYMYIHMCMYIYIHTHIYIWIYFSIDSLIHFVLFGHCHHS